MQAMNVGSAKATIREGEMEISANGSKPAAATAINNVLQYLCLLLLCGLGTHAILARAQTSVVLVGSGSSVPAPLYNRWTQEYGKRTAGLQMRYLPVGTSEGIKQISHSTGDFGAGESQLTDW